MGSENMSAEPRSSRIGKTRWKELYKAEREARQELARRLEAAERVVEALEDEHPGADETCRQCRALVAYREATK